MNPANFYLQTIERFIIRKLPIGLFLAVICSTNICYSQYNFSLGVNYVYAFGERTINFQDATYTLNTTQGYEVTANNSFRFKNTKIQTVLEVGFRQLFFSGNSDNSSYHGELYKLTSAFGLGYSFTDKLSATGYIEAENNLDFEEFNTGTGDLFRISLSLESTYMLTEKLGATFLLSRAMTPLAETYIIINPQYQVRAGLIYNFLK